MGAYVEEQLLAVNRAANPKVADAAQGEGIAYAIGGGRGKETDLSKTSKTGLKTS